MYNGTTLVGQNNVDQLKILTNVEKKEEENLF